MDSEIILPPDYKPSADEEYMNEYQVEYFRQKLLSWKKSLLEQSKDTLEDLRQGGLNQPDQLDRVNIPVTTTSSTSVTSSSITIRKVSLVLAVKSTFCDL